MFYAIDVEAMIPASHPLRAIKARVDAELARMSRLFARACADTGRPGVPPETLLKALLLQALYGIRSEAQTVDRLRTDLLFRWFCDLDPAQEVFDPTAFTHNRPRLERFGILQRFFEGVVRQCMDKGLTSDEHFSVDGTLIQSYASLKSLKPIEPAGDGDDDDDDRPAGKNPDVDFRGQKRSNATHRSTTDAEARLFRKGDGQPAILCHSGHVVTENRHGLVMSVSVDEASGLAERARALGMLDDLERRGITPSTLGADKHFDSGPFIEELERRGIDPHIAIRAGPINEDAPGGISRWLCRQMSRTKGHKTSQRRRKMLEEAFGWIKDYAGLWRTRLVGRWKLKGQMQIAAAAYNLVRMTRLLAG